MKQTEKHVQIMTAAAALFAKYGYKKTSIDEIVSAAGISKGLFTITIRIRRNSTFLSMTPTQIF